MDIAKFLTGGVGKLVDSIGKAFDDNLTSDEERAEQANILKKTETSAKVALRKLDIKEREIEADLIKAKMADTDSARDNQSLVQQSKEASWLSKNVQPALAVFIIGVTFYLFYVLIAEGTSGLGEDRDLIFLIIGYIAAMATQVIGYFYGSSSSSSMKTQLMMKK